MLRVDYTDEEKKIFQTLRYHCPNARIENLTILASTCETFDEFEQALQ